MVVENLPIVQLDEALIAHQGRLAGNKYVEAAVHVTQQVPPAVVGVIVGFGRFDNFHVQQTT